MGSWKLWKSGIPFIWAIWRLFLTHPHNVVHGGYLLMQLLPFWREDSLTVQDSIMLSLRWWCIWPSCPTSRPNHGFHGCELLLIELIMTGMFLSTLLCEPTSMFVVIISSSFLVRSWCERWIPHWGSWSFPCWSPLPRWLLCRILSILDLIPPLSHVLGKSGHSSISLYVTYLWI